MRLWIDCEWNSYKGDLISVALVDENGKYFYESLGCENPDPWVAEHVMPIIHTVTVDKARMQKELQEFLSAYPSLHVIADWPEDIERFCEMLITGPGQRLDTPPLTMEVVRIDSDSKLPHNALADAIGLKEAYLAAL